MRRETHPQTRANTRVINKRFSSKTAIKLSVWIGRPSKWGNRHAVRREVWRDAAMEAYEVDIAHRLINGDITDTDFQEFDGKNMLCVCKPKRCHGDTLLQLYKLSHEERLLWAKHLLEKNSLTG